MQERLEYLDREYLSAFDAIEVPSKSVLPEKFEEIHTELGKYSISLPIQRRQYVPLPRNAAIGKQPGCQTGQCLSVIEYVLLSAPERH